MFGLFIKEGDDAGNKCVMKNGPHERVGIVCKKGGKYNVVEYSELSEEIATKTAEDGSLEQDSFVIFISLLTSCVRSVILIVCLFSIMWLIRQFLILMKCHNL